MMTKRENEVRKFEKGDQIANSDKVIIRNWTWLLKGSSWRPGVFDIKGPAHESESALKALYVN